MLASAKPQFQRPLPGNEIRAERPIDQDVVTVMLNVVDAIEAKHMKGITIDVGQGVKAKVSKMAKESIKVERSETSKKIYEE